jgi:hypothetical protein
MGRWKKEGNQFPPSNKLVQEENSKMVARGRKQKVSFL